MLKMLQEKVFCSKLFAEIKTNTRELTENVDIEFESEIDLNMILIDYSQLAIVVLVIALKQEGP